MSDWKKYKFINVCTKIGSGATPRGGDASYKSEGISLIRSQNVLDFVFSKDGLAFIDEQQARELANVELKKRDVLINITGDSVARVCQVPDDVFPARVNQHVAILRTNQSLLNPEFLKYALLSKRNKEILLTLASTGATRKALTKSMLEQFEIEAPECINEQQRIASILSSLDDKIELNRRMNQTLEQIAATLFKKYFVADIDSDNLPEGWGLQMLSEHFEVDKGLSYKGSGLTTKDYGIPMHNLNSVYEGGGYKYEGLKFYNGDFKQKHHLQPWDIIVANTEQGHKYLLIGYPAVIPSLFQEPGIFTHHIYRLRAKENTLISNQYLYYLLLQPYMREQIIAHTNGTTVNMLYAAGLQKSKFIHPTKDLIENFSDLVKPIWKQKENLHTQNETLTIIRDTLLPKLISGEIDVTAINQNEPLDEEVLS